MAAEEMTDQEIIESLHRQLAAAQERATKDARLIGSLTERGARAEAKLYEAQEREKELREYIEPYRQHFEEWLKRRKALAGSPSEKPGSEEEA